MNIPTKFNIGDAIWVVDTCAFEKPFLPRQITIASIETFSNDDFTRASYSHKKQGSIITYDENHCFASFAECQKCAMK